MAATWRTDDLDRICATDEIGIASRRADGSLRPYITVWIVQAGDDVVVRSAYGSGNPWFRRAVEAGVGSIRVGDVEHDVVFTLISPDEAEFHASVDEAYHAKYDRHGHRIVSTVTGWNNLRSTLVLTPA